MLASGLVEDGANQDGDVLWRNARECGGENNSGECEGNEMEMEKAK